MAVGALVPFFTRCFGGFLTIYYAGVSNIIFSFCFFEELWFEFSKRDFCVFRLIGGFLSTSAKPTLQLLSGCLQFLSCWELSPCALCFPKCARKSLVASPKLSGVVRRASPAVEPAAQFDSTQESSPSRDTARVDRLTALSRFSGSWCIIVLCWWSHLSCQFRFCVYREGKRRREEMKKKRHSEIKSEEKKKRKEERGKRERGKEGKRRRECPNPAMWRVNPQTKSMFMLFHRETDTFSQHPPNRW